MLTSVIELSWKKKFQFLVRGVLRKAIFRSQVDLASPLEQRWHQARVSFEDLHRQHVNISGQNFKQNFQTYLNGV